MNRNIFISIVAIIVLCSACDSDNVYDEIKPNVYYEVKSGFQPYSDDTVKVIHYCPRRFVNNSPKHA